MNQLDTIKALIAKDHGWPTILTACFQLSQRGDGIFWGGSAINLAQAKPRPLTPLRIAGILDRVEKAHRGTASYRLRNPETFRRMLIEVAIDPTALLPGDFFNPAYRKAS